jgi:hypothetical protein
MHDIEKLNTNNETLVKIWLIFNVLNTRTILF